MPGGEDAQPVLPPDLERLIVEICTQDIRIPVTKENCGLNLQSTAHRFREWVLPSIFRVLYSTNIYLHLHGSQSEFFDKLNKYGKYTTHLMLKRVILPNDDGDMLVKLLDSCPNLEDLALWQPRTTFYGDVHKALDTSLSNLKRFSTSHYALLNMCKLFPDSYLNITHLDIFSTMDWGILARFRNLTHLCINSNSIHSAVLSWMIDPAHSLLQVVVALDGPREDWRFEDPRYVYLSGVDEVVEEDWLKGGNGGMDFWEFAERIVICRREGFMRDKSPRMIYLGFKSNLKDELTEEGQSWWTERNWTAPGTLSKLKRLSTHYTHIVKEKGVLSDACVNVTHLWLLYMDDEWDKMAELKFRNLTHLRISRSFYYKETGLLDFVAQKDAGPCPLQVIMLSSMNGPYELWDDPRFVFLEGLPGCDMEESEDWYDSAHGAMDLW